MEGARLAALDRETILPREERLKILRQVSPAQLSTKDWLITLDTKDRKTSLTARNLYTAQKRAVRIAVSPSKTKPVMVGLSQASLSGKI